MILGLEEAISDMFLALCSHPLFSCWCQPCAGHFKLDYFDAHCYKTHSNCIIAVTLTYYTKKPNAHGD